MIENPEFTIGELARRTGRSASAIRYYEAVGVLPEPERVGGRRRYAPPTVRRLAVIDTAQRAGLSLQEIIELLGASLGDRAAAERLRRVAERKLPELEAVIERAEVVKRWLQAAAACRCPTLEDCP
ncbi:MAG: MerR family transcriptional regulator, partial [Actinomycetota bacterium]|nr:MerR family transcriptional regulator [Actinomycetota bacterium]